MTYFFNFSAHNEYLEKVYEHCLQTDEFTDIVTTINNVNTKQFSCVETE